MNKEVRIKKIQEIIDRNQSDPFGKQEIPWEDDLVTMNVYKIPLNLLVYNKYNGRILSRTKSLEKQNIIIDEYSEEGKKLIEKLLWNSKVDANKKTQKNIAEFGQQKIGIITKDGIIIDGNRRAMLLNDIQNDGILSGKKFSKKYDYFKAVVLPVTLLENPLEIEKLETSFQMGEDKKLGYNATEKYLKAKELYLRLTNKPLVDLKKLDSVAIGKIADWMGETEGEIKKYLDTVAIMDEYLEYWEYDGIYTQLDKREDQFLSLTKWLNTFYGEASKKANWAYTNNDVDELKEVAFDYIRLRGGSEQGNFDGKEFRNLAEGNSDKHFFGDKEIWKSFYSKHREIVKKLPKESEIDFNSSNLESHLNARDKMFFDSSIFENGTSAFLDNLNYHKSSIEYNKAAEAPEKNLKNAQRAFDAIKQNHRNFAKPEIQDMVKDLGERIFKSLNKNSPSRVLSHIIELLENIDIDKIPVNEIEELKEKANRINQISYRIKKDL